MRSLLEVSAATDKAEALADWVEISTFFNDDRSVSQEDLVRSLVRAGGYRAEEEAREKAAEAFDELSDRTKAIGNALAVAPAAAYPFEVDGDLLRLSAYPFDADQPGLLYSFLLAITRASMDSTSRKLKNIDPTVLFEEICAASLCQFWGGHSPWADVFVTGTSNSTDAVTAKPRFPRLIDLLAGHCHEGGGWRTGARSPGAGDGGLDLAVWRKFYDKRPGNLIGFAQCKTGDHWRTHLGRHNPRSICQRFFRTRFTLAPLPIYMVPCRVAIEEWEWVMDEHTGLLFDRCRITHFGTHVSAGTLGQCKTWLEAVIARELADLVKRGLKPALSPAGATP